MRTRLHLWLDAERTAVMYGIQVFEGGAWKHAHRSGKPLIFEKRAQAEAERAKLQLLRIGSDEQRPDQNRRNAQA